MLLRNLVRIMPPRLRKETNGTVTPRKIPISIRVVRYTNIHSPPLLRKILKSQTPTSTPGSSFNARFTMKLGPAAFLSFVVINELPTHSTNLLQHGKTRKLSSAKHLLIVTSKDLRDTLRYRNIAIRAPEYRNLADAPALWLPQNLPQRTVLGMKRAVRIEPLTLTMLNHSRL